MKAKSPYFALEKLAQSKGFLVLKKISLLQNVKLKNLQQLKTLSDAKEQYNNDLQNCHYAQEVYNLRQFVGNIQIAINSLQEEINKVDQAINENWQLWRSYKEKEKAYEQLLDQINTQALLEKIKQEQKILDELAQHYH